MFMLEPEDGTALRYAGEFMRQDRRFVLEALRQELKPVGWTGDWRFALFGPVCSNQKVKMPQPCHMCQRRDLTVGWKAVEIYIKKCETLPLF